MKLTNERCWSMENKQAIIMLSANKISSHSYKVLHADFIWLSISLIQYYFQCPENSALSLILSFLLGVPSCYHFLWQTQILMLFLSFFLMAKNLLLREMVKMVKNLFLMVKNRSGRVFRIQFNGQKRWYNEQLVPHTTV